MRMYTLAARGGGGKSPQELDKTICHAKQLAEAINMSPAELARMIQE